MHPLARWIWITDNNGRRHLIDREAIIALSTQTTMFHATITVAHMTQEFVVDQAELARVIALLEPEAGDDGGEYRITNLTPVAPLDQESAFVMEIRGAVRDLKASIDSQEKQLHGGSMNHAALQARRVWHAVFLGILDRHGYGAGLD